MRFAGLDLETTGVDRARHVPIQIAVVIGDSWFASDIGWAWDEILIDPAALEINGFTRSRIEQAPNVAIVDRKLSRWLENRAVHQPLFAVGWNVDFDLGFMEKWLPDSRAHFHYRKVDLTALTLTWGYRTDADYEASKKRVKDFSRDILHHEQGIEEQRHDALYDARAALIEWFWFQTRAR